MIDYLNRIARFFVLFSIVASVSAGCLSEGSPQITIEEVDAAESAWLASPSMDYMITVEVDRPDDRRRNMVVVADGEIVEGIVSYWDSRAREWQEAQPLGKDQAYPFTVPGLFEMVSGSLADSGRKDTRVKMEGEPPFPRQIVLGPVIVDGEPFSMTEATITVKHFQEN
jgi:hypothetical protein